MAKFQITDQNTGKKYVVTAPDQASAAEAAKKHFGQAAVSPPADTPGTQASFRDRVNQAAVQQGINQPMQPPPSPEGNPAGSVVPGPVGDALNTFNAYSRGAMDASTFNMGDELWAGVKAPFVAGFDALQGRGFDIPRAFQQELAVGEESASNIRDLNPQAYDNGGILGTIGLMGRGRAGGGGALPKHFTARTALQAGGVGAITEAGKPGTLQERMANAAYGGAAGALVGGVGGKVVSQFAKGAPPVVPTVDELFSKGDAAFKAAKASGAVLAQPSAQKTIAGLRQVLVADGAITPSGKIAGLPKIEHALNLADDYATSNVTMEQLLRIRKQLGKAAASTDKDERALGMALIRQLDDDILAKTPADFASGAQNASKAIREWKTGRELWHTAKKSETVEELSNSAVRQSRKAAAVPVEQATRNKFGNFVEKPKNLRGYSPAEVQALKDVSDGSGFGNAAKQVGRLAPTTLGGLGVKAGIPWAVGNAVGGPVVGTAVAGVSVGLGYVGKIISNLSTANRAQLAQLIVRNGGKLPNRIPQNLSQPLRNAVGNLIIAGGASGGNVAAQLAQAIQVPQASAR